MAQEGIALPQRLIETYLPVFDYAETHSRTVAATVSEAYEAGRHLDFSRSWITRWLLRLRGLNLGPTLDDMLERGDFEIVADNGPHEFLIWLEKDGALEIAWNFEFDEVDASHTLVATTTRVRCMTARVKRRFRWYWFAIRPFSGLIRREMLRCLAGQFS